MSRPKGKKKSTLVAEKKSQDSDKRKIIQSRKLFKAGKYRDALKICESIYVVYPSNTANLLLMGALQFQLHNISESIFYCQQNLRVEPNNAEAHSIIGNCVKELGDMSSAFNFYHKAIRIHPRLADAYNNEASLNFQLGKLDAAMKSYEMAISLNKAHSDAMCNLGNVYKVAGKADKAKDKYLEAIRNNPKCAIAWSNLGGIFNEFREYSAAIESYKQAIKISPTFADAHSNLGNALVNLGETSNNLDDIDLAETSYKESLRIRSEFAIALGNFALLLHRRGSNAQASKMLRKAIYIEPSFTDALSNLAGIYFEDRKFDDCLKLCYRALKNKPDHLHVYNNLGIVLGQKGLLDHALKSLTTAIELFPDFSVAYCNIGIILLKQNKMKLAMKYFQKSIELEPMFEAAYINMGNVLLLLKQYTESEKFYNSAMVNNSSIDTIHYNLALKCLKKNDLDNAFVHARKSMDKANKTTRDSAFLVAMFVNKISCNWSISWIKESEIKHILNMELKRKEIQQTVIQPFHALLIPDLEPQTVLDINKNFAKYLTMTVLSFSREPFLHDFTNLAHLQRIKIGYVSSNFETYQSPCLTQGLYRMHNHRRYEIYCYSSAPQKGHHIHWSIEGLDHFVDISDLNYQAAAELIHNDGIHVLVNLDGYTDGSRNEIFYFRPAPIQISLGQSMTMGSDFIDYFVANEFMVPKTLRQYYSEKIIYIPNLVNNYKECASFLYEDDNEYFEIRSKYHISEDIFVYACFNQPYKIDQDLFRTWMNILKGTGTSILVLIKFNSQMEVNLKKEACNCGVDSDRIIFLELEPFDQHIRRYGLVDLYLDTTICSGMATVCEALWTETPTLCLAGNLTCNRIGASLLRSIGMDELVAESIDDYERIAISLSSDENKYIDIIRRLEKTRLKCELFDGDLWVKRFEASVEEALRNRSNGMVIDHILFST